MWPFSLVMAAWHETPHRSPAVGAQRGSDDGSSSKVVQVGEHVSGVHVCGKEFHCVRPSGLGDFAGGALEQQWCSDSVLGFCFSVGAYLQKGFLVAPPGSVFASGPQRMCLDTTVLLVQLFKLTVAGAAASQ